MACEWREKDGFRYLQVDYRGAPTLDRMLAVLEEQVTLLEAEGPGARVLIHVDPNDRPPSQFLDAVKHAMRDRLEPLQVRVAFVGVSGIGRMVLRGLQLVGGRAGGLPFADEEKALAYLARS